MRTKKGSSRYFAFTTVVNDSFFARVGAYLTINSEISLFVHGSMRPSINDILHACTLLRNTTIHTKRG